MNTNNTKVSIIVPVYNCEDKIAVCLNSIINQSYENIEIICINDGSSDNSLSIINKICQNDSRVKGINSEHRGVSFARNLGIKNASGKYLMFCDADDTVDTNWISKLVLGDANYSLCSYFSRPKIKNSWVKKYSDCIEEILENYLFTCRSVCTKCFDAEIVKKNKIKFDEKLECYEDALFILNYLINLSENSNIKYVSERLYFYNQRKKGLHTKVNTDNENYFYKNMLNAIKNSKLPDTQKNLFKNYYMTAFLYFKMTRLVRENKASEVSYIIKCYPNILSFRNLKFLLRFRERLFVLLGSGKLYCWFFNRFG